MRQKAGNIRGNHYLGEDVTNTLATEGVEVTLPNGSKLNATLIENERELDRFLRQDGSVPEKRPFVWMFGPEANGHVAEGMKLTIGGIVYVVDPPLHPQYFEKQVVYLAVATHKL